MTAGTGICRFVIGRNAFSVKKAYNAKATDKKPYLIVSGNKKTRASKEDIIDEINKLAENQFIYFPNVTLSDETPLCFIKKEHKQYMQ